MPTEPAGLRERKKERVKHELKQAALDLFVEHGFDAVTIDQIAAAAEVSKSTFYRYFESKEDVLLGDKEEGLALMRAAFANRPPDEPALEAARHAYLEVAQLFEIDREQKLVISIISRSTPSLAARNLQHQAAFELLVREEFERREPTDGNVLHAWVLAGEVMGTIRAVVDYWLTHGTERSLPSLVGESLEILTDHRTRATAPQSRRTA